MVGAVALCLAVGATAFAITLALRDDEPAVQVAGGDDADDGDAEAAATEEAASPDETEPADDGPEDEAEGADGPDPDPGDDVGDEDEPPEGDDVPDGVDSEEDAAAWEAFGVVPPTPSWIVVLDSLDVDEQSPADAATLIEEYQAHGLDPRLLRSDDYEPLNAGYWVVHLLPFDDRDAAAAACEDARDIAPLCYPREVDAPR